MENINSQTMDQNVASSSSSEPASSNIDKYLDEIQRLKALLQQKEEALSDAHNQNNILLIQYLQIQDEHQKQGSRSLNINSEFVNIHQGFGDPQAKHNSGKDESVSVPAFFQEKSFNNAIYPQPEKRNSFHKKTEYRVGSFHNNSTSIVETKHSTPTPLCPSLPHIEDPITIEQLTFENNGNLQTLCYNVGHGIDPKHVHVQLKDFYIEISVREHEKLFSNNGCYEDVQLEPIGADQQYLDSLENRVQTGINKLDIDQQRCDPLLGLTSGDDTLSCPTLLNVSSTITPATIPSGTMQHKSYPCSNLVRNVVLVQNRWDKAKGFKYKIQHGVLTLYLPLISGWELRDI